MMMVKDFLGKYQNAEKSNMTEIFMDICRVGKID